MIIKEIGKYIEDGNFRIGIESFANVLAFVSCSNNYPELSDYMSNIEYEDNQTTAAMNALEFGKMLQTELNKVGIDANKVNEILELF